MGRTAQATDWPPTGIGKLINPHFVNRAKLPIPHQMLIKRIRVVLRSPCLVFHLVSRPGATLMPEISRAVIHPGRLRRREIQDVEHMPVFLIGKRHRVGNGHARPRIALNRKLHRVGADALGYIAVRHIHDASPLFASPQPDDRIAESLGRERGDDAFFQKRAGNRRKRKRTRARVIPDLCGLLPEQPDVPMRDHHRLPLVTACGPLRHLGRGPRRAVIQVRNLQRRTLRIQSEKVAVQKLHLRDVEG